MTMVVIRHQVARYDAWKAVHDAQLDTREANGALSDRVFRGVNDPNDLLILFEWDAHERARLFVRSEDFNDAMVRGGVTEWPEIWLLKEDDFAAY